ncbi:hypothetical protein MGMO_154c00050 [Methyloglobulus morosus KoM1]|uniref:Uncharacterized protein n=1 Tax=Methyloglobulus morosus KoM1 TaxID=1116472 RepID=V5BPB4_9GAMM|nr:hypothetical protein MGMO_154c00050 [Methyloglobulus morosus KoM1]
MQTMVRQAHHERNWQDRPKQSDGLLLTEPFVLGASKMLD